MEDELADEARTKMHSTTSQAIEMGRQMNARYTLLTHFSQRYARIPRIGPELLKDSVGIAFDNMQVTMSDLPLLPHMYAPLQLMFAEHCVGLELKAANRAKRAKRSPSATGTVRNFSTATNSTKSSEDASTNVQMDVNALNDDALNSNMVKDLDANIQNVTQRTNEHCKIVNTDVDCS